MKYTIAIPTSNKCLCSHFGHCDEFAIYETEDNKIIAESFHNPPPHEPGVYPSWLASMGVDHVIAGGIGQRAISLFNQNNISVTVGAGSDSPRVLVEKFLKNELKSGLNACDH